MIAVNEYDSNSANNKEIKYKNVKGVAKHIEKYLLSFAAVNNRRVITEDHYKYERVCLLIVDFSKEIPTVYNTDDELKNDNLLPENSIATIKNLNFPSFIEDLLGVYTTRFGTDKFIWYLEIKNPSISIGSFKLLINSISSIVSSGIVNFSIKFFW